MSSVLNRTTRQFRVSVNTPDFPVADWIINPDMSATVGEPQRYWVITGDVVSVMNQSAKDAVDAQIETDRLDSIADQLDQTQTFFKAFAQVMLDEINLLRGQHSLAPRTLSQLKTAVRGKL